MSKQLAVPPSIKQIAIYNASFGTRELGPAMLSAIRSIYPNPWVVDLIHIVQLNRDDILYIIICPAGMIHTPSGEITEEQITQGLANFPRHYIAWQLEDLQGRYNNPLYIEMLRRAVAVWDYSVFNIKLLKERNNIEAVYCPPGFNETITTPSLLDGTAIYSDTGRDIDILFLGYCDAYPRRLKIRDECYKTGLRVWFVSDLDIEGMKNAIKRSKVCINVAMSDTFILAKVRMNILLSNQACIVSETSCDTDADTLYSEAGITFVPYDQIISKTCELLKDPETRKKNAIKGYQWYRKRKWQTIFDFNAHLPLIE